MAGVLALAAIVGALIFGAVQLVLNDPHRLIIRTPRRASRAGARIGKASARREYCGS